MYAGLGFVGGGSRPPENRDAYFTGSSGHLSKRNYSHSQKRGADVSIRTAEPLNDFSAFPNINEKLDNATSQISSSQPVPARLTEENTLMQRYNFLESQNKKNSGEIADIHANINDIRREQNDLNINSFKVTVTTSRKLKKIKYVEEENLIKFVNTKEGHFEWTDKNENIVVCYPMKEINNEVWMKSISIDKDIGSMEYSWIQIATEEEGRGVKDFRF